MREIKFRLYDKATKQLVTEDSKDFWSLRLDGSLWYGNAQFTGDKNHIEYPVVIMQYTGLKDKNGKEIYEGDVVTSTVKENKGGVIEWCIPNACFVVREDEFTLIPIDVKNGTDKCIETEVIGNIYENSDLLT